MCSTHVNRRTISALLVNVSFQCQLKSMSKAVSKAGVKLIKNATKPALKYNFKVSVENRRQRQTPVFLQLGISPYVSFKWCLRRVI